MTAKKLVIVGGGFAGVTLAQKLAGRPEIDIVLVDQNNYQFFPPLIYQVATGFLDTSSISYPFRRLLRAPNFSFRLGKLLAVNHLQNTITLHNGLLSYDYLVLALGTHTNYFGMQDVAQHAIPMKTLNDAINLKNKMLLQYEKASLEPNKQKRQRMVDIVVAGGGPTGVELSGMFAEMGRHIFRKDYPMLSRAIRPRIYLVDGAPQLLAAMSPQSQAYAHKKLTQMGVEVLLNMHVTGYDGQTVHFKNGHTIATQNLLWTAGVSGTAVEGLPPHWYGRGMRLVVNAYNKLPEAHNIFALGDACIMPHADDKFAQGHPQVAQPAIQQAKNLANNLLNMQHHKPLKPFTYQDKGSMAIVGKAKAVTDLAGKLHFNGIIAWFIWLFIHLISLIGSRNKLATMLNWAQAYFTNDPNLRSIIRPSNNH